MLGSHLTIGSRLLTIPFTATNTQYTPCILKSLVCRIICCSMCTICYHYSNLMSSPLHNAVHNAQNTDGFLRPSHNRGTGKAGWMSPTITIKAAKRQLSQGLLQVMKRTIFQWTGDIFWSDVMETWHEGRHIDTDYRAADTCQHTCINRQHTI